MGTPTPNLESYARDTMTEIIRYIDTMYPQMWTSAPKSARTSLCNRILLVIKQTLIEAMEDAGDASASPDA
jgi:hypothetical protein